MLPFWPVSLAMSARTASKSSLNSVPLSVDTTVGLPKRRTMRWMNAAIAVFAVTDSPLRAPFFFLTEMTAHSTQRERLSMNERL